MKIVVLDGYPGNPGDLSWDGLKALGDLTVYDRTSYDQVAERCAGAQVVLTNKCPVRKEHIAQLPELKYIGMIATGYDPVDIAFAKERGIVVTNVPGYSSEHVAQLVFSLILELADRVSLHDGAVKNGEWMNCPDFTFQKTRIFELAGKTIGIVGYGSIGRRVGQIARGFGMTVLASARSAKPSEDGVSFVPLDEAFSKSDVVTLHCPLTDQTRGLVNRSRVASMKRGAILINTARGPLVDQEAVLEGLKNGQLGGAGLDVLGKEPPLQICELVKQPNCVVTPHIAWASAEARVRLMDQLAANLSAWLAGRPVNVVNG